MNRLDTQATACMKIHMHTHAHSIFQKTHNSDEPFGAVSGYSFKKIKQTNFFLKVS